MESQSPWPAFGLLAAFTAGALVVATHTNLDVDGVPWLAFGIQSVGFLLAGTIFPRHLAWLAAGLIFLPALAAGVFGLELQANDEGLPLELMALLASPAFAIAFGLGYALRGG